jgi:hypothetical protein
LQVERGQRLILAEHETDVLIFEGELGLHEIVALLQGLSDFGLRIQRRDGVLRRIRGQNLHIGKFAGQTEIHRPFQPIFGIAHRVDRNDDLLIDAGNVRFRLQHLDRSEGSDLNLPPHLRQQSLRQSQLLPAHFEVLTSKHQIPIRLLHLRGGGDDLPAELFL